MITSDNEEPNKLLKNTENYEEIALKYKNEEYLWKIQNLLLK